MVRKRIIKIGKSSLKALAKGNYRGRTFKYVEIGKRMYKYKHTKTGFPLRKTSMKNLKKSRKRKGEY